MRFIVPTIENNFKQFGGAVVGEVEVEIKEKFYIKKELIAATGEMKDIVFELADLNFQLDKNRLVQTQIYVDDAFMGHLQDREQRKQEIEIYIHKRYPWFFSYGTRAIWK